MHEMAKVYLVFLFCSLILCSSFSSSSTVLQSVNYVTASGNDCLAVAGNSTCGTLSSYENGSLTDNSVYYFLSGGVHLLEGPITVANITNISFIGIGAEAPVDITCTNGQGGIVFTGCNGVTVSSLSLNNCSNDVESIVPDERRSPAAIAFHESFNTTLDQVVVHNSPGYGLLAWNAYGMNIMNSLFTENGRNAYIIYAVPETCFSTLNTFELHILSCNFTSSVSTGLALHMQNLFSYRVRVNIDNMLTYNNTGLNFIYAFLDGFPRPALITNTVSHNSSYGLVIYNRNLFSSDSISSSCDNFHDPDEYSSAVIEVFDSDFSYNTIDGVLTLFDQFTTYFKVSALEVQFNRCNFAWNNEAGIFWDRDLDELTVLKVRITDSVFTNNSQFADSGGIFIYRTEAYLENVMVMDNFGSGLLLLSSKVIFSGMNNLFMSNHGYNGGGIGLFHSDLIITKNASISFVENTAIDKGGAIYIERVCGIQISESLENNTLNNIHLTFVNNTAPIGGDIYGLSSPRHCSVNVGNFGDVTYLNIAPGKKLQSATNSVGVCSCSNGGLQSLNNSLNNCFDATFQNNGFVTLNKTVYPGEYIEVPVGVVGFGGPPATYSLTDGVINYLVGGRVVSGIPYNGTHCHVLRKRVYQPTNSTSSSVEILIQAEPSYLNVLSTRTYPFIIVNVTLLPCPEGFSLINDSCQCVNILQDQPAEIDCAIDSEEITVTRAEAVWYGMVNKVRNETCFITDTTCGYDYCTEDSVTFNIDNGTSAQCNFGREGILCSRCPKGQSLILGSNKCKECSNGFLALLILFMLAGIALVGLVIFLNITVSAGTINGLIFYANVIKMYQFIFFPNGPIPFVSQFISWLNLDFGIQVCFYDGMDTYSKAWLQFVFPVYIWILIMIIIALCQLSSKFSKLFGSHVISVLSTLFLLSYIKLLRSIIFVLSPQRLYINCINGNEYSELRWLADPSIHYLDPKHTLLFCFAIALLVLFVAPYTLGLLFSPLLEGYFSKYKICSFLHKLKPIFDAYNAPYKDKLRFWTGYLLVVRLPVLAMESVLNSLNTEKNTLLSVLILLIVLSLTIANCVKGVYRIWYVNLIESFFLLNAVIIAVAATNDVYSNTYKAFAVLSIVLSFIVFAVIICFHIYLKFSHGGDKETELKMQRLSVLLLKKMSLDSKHKSSDERGHASIAALNSTGYEWHTKDDIDTRRSSDNNSYPNSTSSTVELRRRETLILDDSQYLLVSDD